MADAEAVDRSADEAVDRSADQAVAVLQCDNVLLKFNLPHAPITDAVIVTFCGVDYQVIYR